VSLCSLCLLLSLNFWAGYVQTVDGAWNFFTRGHLPDQADLATVTSMQANGQVPVEGRVVQVTIADDASHFRHRGELVYLPPAWFATSPPVKLPVVMMIGGEFGSSADWIRAGNAIHTIDTFAASHEGNAPVLVFVDKGGLINKDTECVNGPRGNAADHLTKDVVPYVISHFGTSSSAANWGVVGWSAGGTCAADLVVMNPNTFSTFIDIAGDLGPNAGTTPETIERLFGGDAHAWATFDPTTVMMHHDPYPGVAGWFAVAAPPTNSGQSTGAARLRPDSHTRAANSLCATAQTKGIKCAVVPAPGKHDWLFATAVFHDALPWLAGQLGTPGVAQIALPDGNPHT
jgi:S-formylglutathione hydrolase FrmB